jgi:hypothetical protein
MVGIAIAVALVLSACGEKEKQPGEDVAKKNELTQKISAKKWLVYTVKNKDTGVELASSLAYTYYWQTYKYNENKTVEYNYNHPIVSACYTLTGTWSLEENSTKLITKLKSGNTLITEENSIVKIEADSMFLGSVLDTPDTIKGNVIWKYIEFDTTKFKRHYIDFVEP